LLQIIFVNWLFFTSYEPYFYRSKTHNLMYFIVWYTHTLVSLGTSQIHLNSAHITSHHCNLIQQLVFRHIIFTQTCTVFNPLKISSDLLCIRTIILIHCNTPKHRNTTVVFSRKQRINNLIKRRIWNLETNISAKAISLFSRHWSIAFIPLVNSIKTTL